MRQMPLPSGRVLVKLRKESTIDNLELGAFDSRAIVGNQNPAKIKPGMDMDIKNANRKKPVLRVLPKAAHVRIVKMAWRG
jgi:hypothetical protein